MTPRPDPFTEIREALRLSASLPLSVPESRYDELLRLDELTPQALATLSRLEREAAERETAHAWLVERFTDEDDPREPGDVPLLDLVQSVYAWGDQAWHTAGKELERADAANSRLHDAVTRAESAEARVREVEAERDRLKDALRFYGDDANYAFTLEDAARGRNQRVVDDNGHRARAVLANPEAAAADPGCARHEGDPHTLCPECWKAEAAATKQPHPKWCEKHACWHSLSTRTGRSCCWECESAALPAVDAPHETRIVFSGEFATQHQGAEAVRIELGHRVECSCGWEWGDDLTKAQAQAKRDDHLRRFGVAPVDAPPEPTT